MAPPQDLPPFIPPLTDEDRKAAFPDVEGHAVHDRAVHYFVLFDQLEWQTGGGANGLNLDSRGWIGRDRDRFWFRAEGDGDGGRVGEAQAHAALRPPVLALVGCRRRRPPGLPAGSGADVGGRRRAGTGAVWFEVEATAYVGASGRTHARLEVEYELLLTNRLVLQPLVRNRDHVRQVGSRARHRRRPQHHRSRRSVCATRFAASSRRTSA